MILDSPNENDEGPNVEGEDRFKRHFREKNRQDLGQEERSGEQKVLNFIHLVLTFCQYCAKH